MPKYLRSGLLSLLLIGGAAMASPEENIKQQLLKLQPDMGIQAVNRIPGKDLYEVRLQGSQVVYVDAAVSLLMHGELYSLAGDEPENLSARARQEMTAVLMQQQDPADMVVFPAADKKASITVFTDVDCGYCQKLHQEVPALNQAGVEVRYLAWPRQGLAGDTYESMVSIWCADDQQQAMTRAKSRQSIAAKTCKNPVDKQYALGQQLGLRGTPAILLDNGELIPGYVPAAQLAARAIAVQ